MPIYLYQNPKTKEIFEAYMPASDYKKPYSLADGTKCPRYYDFSNIQTVDKGKIRLNGDPRREAEYEKRSKDPERARKLRKDKFGTEGVSITKSEHFHKQKRVKAQGNSDVSKVDFVKNAARNPNALKAAAKAIRKKID
jgi:hypothetical protein